MKPYLPVKSISSWFKESSDLHVRGKSRCGKDRLIYALKKDSAVYKEPTIISPMANPVDVMNNLIHSSNENWIQGSTDCTRENKIRLGSWISSSIRQTKYGWLKGSNNLLLTLQRTGLISWIRWFARLTDIDLGK